MTDERMLELLFDLHDGLAQEGPGEARSTLRALDLCTGLPPSPRILDIGCGPGRQSEELLRHCSGEVVITDLFPCYLHHAGRRLRRAGAGGRHTAVRADMRALPFAAASFDLLWSEGAIYHVGFAEGLRQWKRLLREGACAAVTDLCWTTDIPPLELQQFFAAEGVEVFPVEHHLAAAEALGYQVLGHFTLPDSAWWSYYDPIAARLPGFLERHEGDPEALAYAAMERQEQEMRRLYADSYGYEFFVLRSGTYPAGEGATRTSG